jgi:hypothetical protein
VQGAGGTILNYEFSIMNFVAQELGRIAGVPGGTGPCGFRQLPAAAGKQNDEL